MGVGVEWQLVKTGSGLRVGERVKTGELCRNGREKVQTRQPKRQRGKSAPAHRRQQRWVVYHMNNDSLILDSIWP